MYIFLSLCPRKSQAAPSKSLFRVQIKGAVDSIVNLSFFVEFSIQMLTFAHAGKGLKAQILWKKFCSDSSMLQLFCWFFSSLSEVCENLDLMKKSSENGIKKNSGIILHLGSGAKMPGACIDNVIIN